MRVKFLSEFVNKKVFKNTSEWKYHNSKEFIKKKLQFLESTWAKQNLHEN